MSEYQIDGLVVVLADASLSVQHREIGGSHYEKAQDVARTRAERETSEVTEWIRENIPGAVIRYEKVGENTVVDELSTILERIFHKSKHTRKTYESQYEFFRLTATMPSETELVAFRLRWD